MKRSKLILGLGLVLVLVLGILMGGCGGKTDSGNVGKTQGTSDTGKKLRLGWTVARQDDHPYTVAAETFAKVVKEKTNGKVQVDLYPGGQLGGDRDMFESIQMGNLDVGVISAPVIASFTQVLVGTDMPYIFNNDYDLLYKAESGPAGQKLLQKLEQATGVKALSFIYQPFRHFFTNRPIKSLDDMKGLKLRCMETPVHIDIFKALGANPTPLPYNDVYTAMQTGTIDGFESDVIGANASKFYEVSKYITISGHFNNAVVMVMSEKTWAQLSPEEQQAVQDAANEAAKASLDITKKANDKYMQVMKDKGVTINEVDLKPFIEAEKPVIDKYEAQIPEVKEFVEAVRNMK
ncbi:Sialic acid-binding periplasmic protein SiaP [Moorella thermoacetica]|uniref:Sialic acid-binding periplasmic protein SiaP n=1 Tax=Neomoorella thermoacetica TaxID=1525 RepID=A0AAC9HFA7_NEOTH|nr:TRAP transporter substrate-binding protein [Moorella thermoacetica]AOQ22917.1 Sialic acid-binding periplasmic protein SiaP precursor [Moorella thermoacetica]TYL10554.1 Sialic acid-binding periplasmic protein SiaP [Moorella thermoacetica]